LLEKPSILRPQFSWSMNTIEHRYMGGYAPERQTAQPGREYRAVPAAFHWPTASYAVAPLSRTKPLETTDSYAMLESMTEARSANNHVPTCLNSGKIIAKPNRTESLDVVLLAHRRVSIRPATDAIPPGYPRLIHRVPANIHFF